MPELPLVGDEFAGFRLRSIVGQGGMSVVYRCENPRLGNVIALKVLAPELATDDVFRARFLEESRIAAAMNHPHVIPIHDMGSCDGLLYIAMRCVMGTDLRHMLKKRGRLAPGTAIFLLSQAARALDAAHRRGLVHRDVKPGNLLVELGNDDTDPDHVYLADFGITKPAAERGELGFAGSLPAAGEFLGTIDYVAPEQIRGLPVLGLADQYSLGCVLYECLTGQVPFDKALDAAIILAHVEEPPVQPTRLRPDLPPEVDGVFARVLAKQPGDRYESCREFMAAARDALGIPAGDLSADRPPRPARPEPVSAPLPARVSAPLAVPLPARVSAPLAVPLPAPLAGGYREVTHDPLDTDPLDTDPLDTDPLDTDPLDADPFDTDPFDADPFDADPFDADRPRGAAGAGRGSDRGSLRVPLLALAAAIVIAAVAGMGAAFGPSRGGTPAARAVSVTAQPAAAPAPASMAPSASASPSTAAPPASALLAALAPVQDFTGRLSLSACKEPSSTLVTCAGPDPKGAIASATFQTFPGLTALYVAYQADVAAMAGKPFPEVQNTQNCGEPAPQPMGEISWNHTNQHTLKYSVAQLAAGSVPGDMAAGRMFCVQLPGGGENIIWTQNFGDLLVVAHGAVSHEQVWLWFVAVHHNIAFKGQPAMPGMPMG